MRPRCGSRLSPVVHPTWALRSSCRPTLRARSLPPTAQANCPRLPRHSCRRRSCRSGMPNSWSSPSPRSRAAYHPLACPWGPTTPCCSMAESGKPTALPLQSPRRAAPSPSIAPWPLRRPAHHQHLRPGQRPRERRRAPLLRPRHRHQFPWPPLPCHPLRPPRHPVPSKGSSGSQRTRCRQRTGDPSTRRRSMRPGHSWACFSASPSSSQASCS